MSKLVGGGGGGGGESLKGIDITLCCFIGRVYGDRLEIETF